jgi:hypothetical protein
MTAVREVLVWLQANVQFAVDDISGEASRLRQQIATDKQAMQADMARAESVKPIMPAFVQLIDDYRQAKAGFEELEKQPDLRAALAAQATLANAARALAGAGGEHDRQSQAMNDCAQWRETNGAALKQALETPDITEMSDAVQQAFAELDAANEEVDESLDKPDFVEALGRYATLEQRLREFELELTRDNDGEKAHETKKAGIAAKVQEARQLIEDDGARLYDEDIAALEEAIEKHDEAAGERRWDDAMEALEQAEDAADELLEVRTHLQVHDAKMEELDPTFERADEIANGEDAALLASEVQAYFGSVNALSAARESLDWEAAMQPLLDCGEAAQALIDASGDRPALLERALANALQAYRSDFAALESGDLARVPERSPVPELADLHAAVVAARQALPADPKTQADADQGQQALIDARAKARAYVIAEAAALKRARAAFDSVRKKVGQGASNLPYEAPRELEAALADVKKASAEMPTKLESLSDAEALTVRLGEIEQALTGFFKAYAEVRNRIHAEYNRGSREVQAMGWGELPRFPMVGTEAEYNELMRIGEKAPRSWSIESDPALMQQMIEMYEELKPALKAYNTKLAELLPARQAELKATHNALYEGALKQVPDRAPAKGLDGLHQAVERARKTYEKCRRGTLEEVNDAMTQLRWLSEAVTRYTTASPQVLAELVEDYRKARAALDAGPLKQVPRKPDNDPELVRLHKGLHQILAKLPDPPTTFDEAIEGRRQIGSATSYAEQYVKWARVVANWRKGMADYGPDGSKRSELKGLEECNPRQLEMFGKLWEQTLPRLDEKELTDEELRAKANELADWAANLSKTKVEKEFPGVNEAITKSETLTDNVVQLQAHGWTIQAGKPGGGSFCQRGRKCIVLDPKDSDLKDVLAGIAHEGGHALFTPPEPPRTHQVSNGLDYVRRGLESGFIDEGEAQMNACKVQKEMAKAGVEYRVAGGEKAFMTIYERFLDGALSVDEARIEMGKRFNDLTASGDDGKPYKRQYGEPLIDNWNSCCSRKSDRLAYDVLDTMTIFG